eukprot:scaffold147225_cov36-Prasinocladus_malaysianus.AAC.3
MSGVQSAGTSWPLLKFGGDRQAGSDTATGLSLMVTMLGCCLLPSLSLLVALHPADASPPHGHSQPLPSSQVWG